MISILLVDDHKLVREGLSSLLSAQDDLEIVGEATNGQEALSMVANLVPQVVVIDVAMPEMNGIDATRQIKVICPDTAVVALSMHADGLYVRRMVDAGALAYVLKDSAFVDLVAAIRAASKGRRYFSPGLGYLAPSGTSSNNATGLTPRETEVLQLIAEGLRTAEVADRLCISGKTVETHRKNIMEKLGLNNVPGLVKYAIRHGIVSLD